MIGRRSFLLGGAGVVVAGIGGGYELVEHGVLPGKAHLDQWLGREHPIEPDVSYDKPGAVLTGSFYSHARNTDVDWVISYPPGYAPGSRLPLILALHPFHGTPAGALGPIPASKLLAATYNGKRLPPMVIAAAAGGDDYWHAHPGDDPMAMLVHEFLPMCRQRGLGVGSHRRIGVTGASMGGYGALLFTEEHRSMVAACAPISPAVWTTYADSQNANPDAFTSPRDFAAHDVTAHAGRLRGIPTRIVSGADDPFHPFLEVLAEKLPASASISFPPGVHDGDFFASQEVPAIAFLGRYLA